RSVRPRALALFPYTDALPIFYSGGGVVQGNASEHLIALARELNYPVTNTLMGLGAYPATDRQFLGMLGMHGTYEANMAMHNADLDRKSTRLNSSHVKISYAVF